MDAESLTQIERIVTAAIGSAEGRLRNETQVLVSSLQQEIGAKTDEVKRHVGVLYEDFSQKIDLVVEGHQALDQKIDKLDSKMEREFLETRAVIQLSYRQLQQRVETLEQRMQMVEKVLGISA